MRITINIPDKLRENLKRAAANRGVSVSGLVSEAVDHYLIEEQRRTLGAKALDLVGKVHVDKNVYEMLEEGRRDDRP